MSVVYNRLDVYKRQVVFCGRKRSDIQEPWIPMQKEYYQSALEREQKYVIC